MRQINDGLRDDGRLLNVRNVCDGDGSYDSRNDDYVSGLEDWDGVTIREVYKNGGCGLLKKYHYSLRDALAATYHDR